MKHLILSSILFFLLLQIHAQKSVRFNGELQNFSSSEIIYLGLDQRSVPLEISEDGSFSVEIPVELRPFFFRFSKISKRGKIEPQTPLIWAESDSVYIVIDWTDKSFEFKGELPFQEASENLEAAKGKERLELILQEPNSIPSLYFADKHKEDISEGDLEKILAALDYVAKKTIYAKRIDAYLSAMKKSPLKKGHKPENFELPDKNGEYISVLNDEGKTQVIALFSSGCAYSIRSIDLLEQIAKLNNDKIEIVTIWDDSNKEIWLNTYQNEKAKITWTNLWDEYGFAKMYLNRKLWPTFYIINEEGELAEILKGYHNKTAKALKALVQ